MPTFVRVTEGLSPALRVAADGPLLLKYRVPWTARSNISCCHRSARRRRCIRSTD
jgi:hypothetical protein